MENPEKNTKGPVMLPIVKIGKKRYFADSRLRELRNIKNPHDCLDFSDSEWVILNTFLDPEFMDRFLGQGSGGNAMFETGRREPMYCPDCGEKMLETRQEMLDRGAFTETVRRYKCSDCEIEWEASYDTMNQERVLRVI